MRSSDTDQAASAAKRAAHRAMGPAGRVRLAIDMSEHAREISARGLLARNPGMSVAEARARILRHVLGDALFEAAWPQQNVR